MRNIAIITARGGSKRIPKKNIKNFCGKPIISYSVDAALKSGIFDTVMVSTDDDEIAKIAVANGADVPFMRSNKNSDDFSTTSQVLYEVLQAYKSEGTEFDNICCLYPTAPFLSPNKLKEAFDILLNDADAVVPVVKFDFPPQRGFIVDNGIVQYKYPEFASTRSQDLQPIYHDCGQFYFIKTNVFLKERTLIVPNTKPIILDSMHVQDIDEESDWKLAEAKYKILSEKGLV